MTGRMTGDLTAIGPDSMRFVCFRFASGELPQTIGACEDMKRPNATAMEDSDRLLKEPNGLFTARTMA
jgi:hypothetical protein